MNSKKSIKNFREIDSNYECDILVIGAGITGLTCAYYLSKARKKSNCS